MPWIGGLGGEDERRGWGWHHWRAVSLHPLLHLKAVIDETARLRLRLNR